MAEGAQVNVNPTPLTEKVAVIVPHNVAISYGDKHFPIGEEHKTEMDLATALELERQGYIKRA